MSASIESKLLEVLQQSRYAPGGAVSGYSEFLKACAVQTPSSAWTALGKLDFKAFCRETQVWLSRVIESVESKHGTRGLLIGIQTRSDKSVPTGYVLQAECFSEFECNNLEWAAESDNFLCMPDSATLESVFLDSIFQLIQKQINLRNTLDYVASFSASTFALDSALNQLKCPAKLRSIGIALCWSGGDGSVLGELTKGGFKPLPLEMC